MEEDHLHYKINKLYFNNYFVLMSFYDCFMHFLSAGAFVSIYIHLTFPEARVTVKVFFEYIIRFFMEIYFVIYLLHFH